MQQLPYYPFITRGGPIRRKLTYDAVVYTEDGHYFAEDSNGHIFCQDSSTACIQEAVNYVINKPTGGKVNIRAGDYYLAPLNTQNCGYADICASIPYNEALIVEGDGDATRIHLPQNNLADQAWLFSWGWNGNAPYTRKSKLRNIAFINDENTGSYAMNVMVAGASPNSSGLEVDSVSVYDIQGTGLNSTFWINGMYDVTFSRYRFFSVNSNKPGTAVLFDSVSLGKIVDSFMYTVNGGSSAISNGTGSILVDSVEMYGPWGSAFNFGITDGESSINVTNSIIGINRTGSQGIQGLNNTAYGPSNLIFNGGNGTVRFTIEDSVITYCNINANSSTNNMWILVRNNMIENTPSFSNLNSSGGGMLYLDFEGNIVFNEPQLFVPMGGTAPTNGTYNFSAYFRRNKFYLSNGPWILIHPSSGSSVFENNDIYISNMYPPVLALYSTVSYNGVVKFINNMFIWTNNPSSATTQYLVTPYSSGTVYMPGNGVVFKNNTFNFPTSNFTFDGFVGSASSVANPNALFVDLDNTFNLSGINLPYPSVSTPSVPASGTAQSNTYQYPVEVYVSGGSATAVQVTRGGVTYTVWSSSTATAIPPLLVRLEPGDSIMLTYSTAPSWTWVPAKYIR